jgi:hypothetical protein
MQFKLGCDPELFMADINGKLRAACGLIGGSKQNPRPLPLGDGYMVQEDNVAIEFNTPPAANAAEFIHSVSTTMEYLMNDVRRNLNFTIVNLSAASFPDDELQAPSAKEFGCDPDFNAWTGRKNQRPQVKDANLRSAGGHVHVGFDKRLCDGKELIKWMDMYLGVPSVLMDEAGDKRRPLYGKSGAFREKPYGFEYRTLSNFWTFNPRLMQWIWDNTRRAVDAAVAQIEINKYKDSIYTAINKNNKQVALDLVNEFNLEVIHV